MRLATAMAFTLTTLLAFATTVGLAKNPTPDATKGEVNVEHPFDPRPLMDKLRADHAGKSVDHMFFLVFGDAKHSPHFSTVLKHADELKPDFCITTADLVSSGAGNRGVIDYKTLEDQGGWFLRKYPTWPTVGNHEESGGKNGVRNFSNFFGMERDQYSFEYGNAKFIALGWPKTDKDPARLSWLESELKSGQGKHIFVFQHRPYYTVGSKSHSDVEGKPNATTKLFEKYHVVAVFSGHDHIYYHTQRNGVNYVISAGAGAPIYPLTRIKEAIPGDVFYGRSPDGSHPFIYHNADGETREIPGPMHYVVSIEITGDDVHLKMIDSTHDHQVWDDAHLTRTPQAVDAKRSSPVIGVTIHPNPNN